MGSVRTRACLSPTGHGLSFKENDKVDTKLYVQIIDMPHTRQRIKCRVMRSWYKNARGHLTFVFKKGDPACEKQINGVEVVNRFGRSLAKLKFGPCVLPKDGGSIDVTIK